MKTKHNGNYELPTVTILLTYRDFPSNSFKDYKVLETKYTQTDRPKTECDMTHFVYIFVSFDMWINVSKFFQMVARHPVLKMINLNCK